jgi:hypothetical protein
VTSPAAAVTAMTDLANLFSTSDGANRDAVRPTADRLNRSLEPDVLGDHHVARGVDDSPQGSGSDRPRPQACQQAGVFPSRG